jgi:syntaxin 16
VLLVTFDGGHDAKDHAEALTRELQMGFKNLNAEISGIQSIPGSDDAEVRKEVKQQLARALMSLTMEFRKEETRFLSKVEAQKGLAAGSAMGLVESAHLDEDTDLLDPGFSQTQAQAADSMSAVAIERDREIVKIVETITELAQIMRDLGALVVEQGTILDRIDCNIADTEVKITEGVRHIQQAEKKQKSTRMFMCIVGLVIFIVVMLIIIAAKVLL